MTEPASEYIAEQRYRQRASVGFWLATAFLLLVGQILPHGGTSDYISEFYFTNPWVLGGLFSLWALIIIEAIEGLRHADDGFKAAAKRCLLNCLVPPTRMTLATAWSPTRIWLPKLGWQWSSHELFTELEFKLTLPMLIITLLILPVMAVELLMAKQLEQSPSLSLLLHHTTAFIWAAFAAEFILLISVAQKKLDYCKKNWINIVIIILPLVGFLRSLRLFRMFKLAKASKLARAYRLRGLLLRAQRLAMLFNLIERFLHRNPEKYLATLREREQKKLEELSELQTKIQDLEELLAQREAAKD